MANLASRRSILLRASTVGAALAIGAIVLAGCTSSSSDGVAEKPSAKPSASAPQAPTAMPSLAKNETTDADREAATADLFAAVYANDLGAAQSAIDAGADLDLRADQGRTPLIVATKANRVEMALLLLDEGSDPNIQDDLLDSAFLYAGAEGMDEILTSTIKYGADVTMTNRYGGTALIPAGEHGHVTTAAILIEAGVPVDHINDLGWTALHEAILFGHGSEDHLLLIRQLFEAGADPTLADGDGTSPRDLAEANGYDNIVAEIEKYL